MPTKKRSLKKTLRKQIACVGGVCKDHFIPHEGNNHHPHVLHHRVLVGYSVLLILLKTLAIVVTIALPSASVYSSAITVQNILTLTNAARQNAGLVALSLNTQLIAAAQAKAQDMLTNQYFSHTSVNGWKPWDWIKQTGYQYLYAGENLAVHYVTSEDLQEGWMASPSHRANIVNTRYTETGVGIVNGIFEGYPSTFVVQMFGTPKEPEPEPAPQTTEPITPSPEIQRPAPNDTKTPVTPTASTPTSATTIPKPTQPKPTPTPVASAPVVLAEMTSYPTINETETRITPKPTVVDVSVTIDNASTVTALLAGISVPLVQEPQTNVWRGEIPYTPAEFPVSGERISLSVSGADGSQHTEDIGVIAPRASTREMFVFNEKEPNELKLFGFITVNNMRDSTRRFYVAFITILAAALLLNIFVKVRIQKGSVIAHTAAVLGLAVFLLIL